MSLSNVSPNVAAVPPESPVSPVSPVSQRLTFHEAAARVRVVLCQTSHPGNIGAAARAMKTMGFTNLVLVQPRHFPNPQALAMAAGADDVLASARVVDSLSEALAGTVMALALTARRRELAVAPVWARSAAGELASIVTADDAQSHIALVFGNETSGLSNDDLLLCRRWAMIPTNPEFSSLNVGAAVQLMCYELRQALLDPGTPPAVSDSGEAATHDDVERLMAHLEQVAIESGFLDPASPKRMMPRMRRMFARAVLEREEVNILRGVLAAVQKPFKKNG